MVREAKHEYPNQILQQFMQRLLEDFTQNHKLLVALDEMSGYGQQATSCLQNMNIRSFGSLVEMVWPEVASDTY